LYSSQAADAFSLQPKRGKEQEDYKWLSIASNDVIWYKKEHPALLKLGNTERVLSPISYRFATRIIL